MITLGGFPAVATIDGAVTDPLVLAELAMTRMRGKREILAEALRGRFTDHHAFMVRAMLDRIDACTAMEARLSTRNDDCSAS